MKRILLTTLLAVAMNGYSQNLLTQNPSFENYTGDQPDGWVADEALIQVVMDATDGSMGLWMKKDPDPAYAGTIAYRVATTQSISLAAQPLSLKFDYKVLDGLVNTMGFIMLPDTYEFAEISPVIEDGVWHLNNYADM